MAAKKTTKKSTAKKTTKKSKPEMFTITYDPVGFNANVMSFPLKTKKYDGMNLVSIPAIEGLPMDLIFHKGDKLQVTAEQLTQLQLRGIVESNEEREARKAFIKNLPDQFPNTANNEDSKQVKALLTENDLQSKIYNDKLIICD